MLQKSFGSFSLNFTNVLYVMLPCCFRTTLCFLFLGALHILDNLSGNSIQGSTAAILNVFHLWKIVLPVERWTPNTVLWKLPLALPWLTVNNDDSLRSLLANWQSSCFYRRCSHWWWSVHQHNWSEIPACYSPVWILWKKTVDVVFHTDFLFWLNFYLMNTADVERSWSVKP